MAPASPRPSSERRDRADEAMSRKCALSDVLHSGPRHAFAHFSWHVTADRFGRAPRLLKLPKEPALAAVLGSFLQLGNQAFARCRSWRFGDLRITGSEELLLL